jgi:hypothetical protein
MEIFKDTTFVTMIKSFCLQELQRSVLFCQRQMFASPLTCDVFGGAKTPEGARV